VVKNIMTDTVDQKLLKQTKFPPEFNQKVDMQKVNIEVMKKYVVLTRMRHQLLTCLRNQVDSWQAFGNLGQ